MGMLRPHVGSMREIRRPHVGGPWGMRPPGAAVAAVAAVLAEKLDQELSQCLIL